MYGITFDDGAGQSQYRQLVEQLRARISAGAIPGGSRLASSRELSGALNVARGIVLEAIDQLKLEGYLETRQGSGTYVIPGLAWKDSPGEGPAPRIKMQAPQAGSQAVPQAVPGRGNRLSFAPGMPDLTLFPKRAWLSCYHDAVEYADGEDLGYCPPAGNRRLREAIAAHVREIKGIDADPERIVVAAGASQCFAVLAGLFEQCRVLMEDPHAPFVRRVFDGLGARITLVKTDEEGILPEAIPDAGANLLYVTPNHQFPLGGTLSAARRVRLLERARAIGAWIVEDDFDSEFRYGGKPVAPLKVMDSAQVVYVGTFSKTVSPALRIGFMILPQGLLARVKTAKRRWDYWNDGLEQKAMALFIERGHLSRHLARCHRSYRRKRDYLTGRLEAAGGGAWEVLGGSTGMHLVIRSRGRTLNAAKLTASELKAALGREGLAAEGVEDYCLENRSFPDALIIAYGNRTTEELDRLVAALTAISQCC